jgi:hypothetical protein
MIRRGGAPAGLNGDEQPDHACGEDAMGGLRLTREEEAEVLRKKHQYRRLILSGRLSLPHSRAAQLVGPDCMYHLYSLQHAPGTGRARKKPARRPPALNKSRPRS